MGNQVKKAINCCQPSAPHQEVEMDSIKPTLAFPKIQIIQEHEPSDNQTEPEPSKAADQPFLSTADSTFSPQATNNLQTVRQEVTLRMNDLSTTQAAKEIIKVPFNVIKLSLSKKLLNLVNHYCEQILGRLQEEAIRWQLTKNGHYVSIINQTFISLFSETSFYEGQVKVPFPGYFVPNRDGLLVTQEGIYKGSFQDGKAHGKGTFIHGESKTSFKGEWREGIFMEGVVQNCNFKFLGQMKEGLADGNGKIVFKQDGSEYKGCFKDGIYEGQDGVLACPHYSYKGGFKRGFKCGKGTLEEKEQKIDLKVGSTRIKKYRPPASLIGEWKDDNLVTITPTND